MSEWCESVPMLRASVPELVKRTISTDGTASITFLASTFSRAEGAPNEVPGTCGEERRGEEEERRV